jgi:hypothetical protein
MDLNRFQACAAAYGADRRRWPAQDAALYDRLAATAEGAAILAEAQRTDRFLDAFEAGAPGAALAQRVAATPLPSWRSLWLPAAAFAASAALGFVVGFAQARGVEGGDFVARLLFGPQSVQEIGL